MMEPGIYSDLSNDIYHNDPAISRSGLMMFYDSPYKYWANYLNPLRPAKKSTPAMEFGSAFHTAILEPHLFSDTYTIMPEKVLLKDVGREIYDDYKEVVALVEESNRIILSYEEGVLIGKMGKALQKHEALDLIQGAVYEQSYFWEDKDSGLMVKARPDILHDNMIVDLKTIVSANSRYYQRTMVESWYHVQGAMIREGIRELTGKDISNVINICIEKTYPFEIGIKIISEEALEAGRKIFKSVCVDLKSAIVHNNWKSYEPETVELPTWLK